jgi:hypothetical protein
MAAVAAMAVAPCLRKSLLEVCMVSRAKWKSINLQSTDENDESQAGRRFFYRRLDGCSPGQPVVLKAEEKFISYCRVA